MQSHLKNSIPRGNRPILRGRPKADLDLLRDRWSRWTAILSSFARNRPDRRQLDPRAYAILRNELITACRSLAETEGPERHFYVDLEQTVDPWLDLGVLARTDREILHKLVQRSLEVERKLRGGKSRPARRSHWGPATVALAGAAAIGALVWLLLISAGLPALGTLRWMSRTIWMRIAHADAWEKSSVTAAILIVLSMRLVSRISKS
jgi:hypothetical protein